MVPLPECASGEWGPNKAYRLFGLIPVTHEDAIINAGRELEIRFRMQRPLAELVAALHKNGFDDKKLTRYVSHSIKGEQVVIRLQFPEEGQYGLDLYTRERAESRSGVENHQNHNSTANGGTSTTTKQMLTHCCKYLINARL